LRPLKILAPAKVELQEATRWYHDRDPRVAMRFSAAVRRTLHMIESFPQIGGSVPDVENHHVRRLPVHAFPYHVVFVSSPDRLEVLAFAHDRRRPAYFMARLRRS
jgi:plasmid stabilization system protein ParE